MVEVGLIFIGLALVALYILIWTHRYSWFSENRKFTDRVPRSNTSWNKDHEFFDTITEFQDDFS